MITVAQLQAEFSANDAPFRAAMEKAVAAVEKVAAATARLSPIEKQREAIAQAEARAQSQLNALLATGDANAGRLAARYNLLTNAERESLAATQQAIQAEQARFRSVTNLGDRLQSVGDRMKSVGVGLSLAVTVPLSALGGKAVQVFGEFERNLNSFQAATRATADEMSRVSRLAEQLGADLTLPNTSAKDAAEAMTELANAGLSVQDSMGAARGALQLGAAAGVSAGRAAEIAANALNAFGLAGDQAGRVADLLAGAANSASGKITDMAQGFRQAATSFKQAGFSVEDLTTAMALMAKAGVQGSDAGTSLRVMAGRLVPQTKQAAAAMKALRVETLDASDNIKPLRDQIAQFSQAIARLPSGQKVNVLKAIFGEDAQRAAGILFQGTKAFDDMAKAVTRQGQAAELAGAKNKGLLGAIDAMKSAFEGAAIAGIRTVSEDLRRLAISIAGLVNKFAELDPTVRRALLFLAGGAALIGPLLVALGNLVAAWGRLIPVFTAARTALAAVNVAFVATGAIIGVTVAAVAGFAYAFATNMNGVRDAAVRGWQQIREAFQAGIAAIGEGLASGWNVILEGIVSFFTNFRNIGLDTFRGLVDDFNRGLQVIAQNWRSAGSGFLENLKRGWQVITGQQGSAPAQEAGKSQAVAFNKGFAQIRAPQIKLPTIRNPALDALGAGAPKTRTGKSPLEQQLESLAKARRDAQIELGGRRAGQSRELIELRKQYDLLGASQLSGLSRMQQEIASQDRAKQALEQFRQARQQANIELKKSEGIDTTLLELRKQFPSIAEKERLALAQTLAATKKNNAEKQLEQEAERKRKSAVESAAAALRDAQIEAEAWGQSNEAARLAMQQFKVTADQLTDAQKEWGAAMQAANITAEENRRVVEQDRQEQDRLRDAQQQTFRDLKNLRQAFAALTSGSKEAVLAWEQYGLVFDEIDKGAQQAIRRQLELQDAMDLFKTFADGVRGIFEGMFNSLFERGFKGFFGNVIQGFSKLLQQMAVQFLTSQLMDVVTRALGSVFSGAFGGGEARAYGGMVAANRPYLVGERGPELFMPSQSGRIQAAGASGVVVNMTVNATDAGSFRKNEAAIQAQLFRAAERVNRRNGGG